MARWWRKGRLRNCSRIRRPTTPALCSRPRSGWRPRRMVRPAYERDSNQPLDGCDLVARGLDSRDGATCRLDGRSHVVSVGMNDGGRVANDRDMAFPEDQVAALQFFRFRRIQCPAEAILLHVAVARAAGAGGVEGYLNKAGAI